MIKRRRDTGEFLMREQSISFLEFLVESIPKINLADKSFEIDQIDNLSINLLKRTLNAKKSTKKLSNKVICNILDNFCSLYNIDTIKRTKIESLWDTCISKDCYTIEDILKYKFEPSKVINCVKGVMPKRALATLLYDLYCHKGLLLFDCQGEVYPLFDLNINGKLIKSIFNYKDYNKLQKSLTQGNKFFITHIASLYECKMSNLYSKFKWSCEVLLPESFHMVYDRHNDKAMLGFDVEISEGKLHDNPPSVVIDTLLCSKKFVKDIQAFNLLNTEDDPHNILGSFYIHLLLHHNILSKTLDLITLRDMCKVFSKTHKTTKAVLDQHTSDDTDTFKNSNNQVFGHIGQLRMRKLYSVEEDIYTLSDIRDTLQLRVTSKDLYLYDLVKKRRLTVESLEDFISRIQYRFTHANLVLKLYTMFLQGYIYKVYRVCKDLYKFNDVSLLCIEEMNHCNGFR